MLTWCHIASDGSATNVATLSSFIPIQLSNKTGPPRPLIGWRLELKYVNFSPYGNCSGRGLAVVWLCTPNYAPCKVFRVRCTVLSIQYTLYNIKCTVHDVHYQHSTFSPTSPTLYHGYLRHLPFSWHPAIGTQGKCAILWNETAVQWQTAVQFSEVKCS